MSCLRFYSALLCLAVLYTRFSCSIALTGKKYYDRLEVGQDADDATLKRAYKKLAYKWHPDRNPDNQEDANKKFMEIAEAYEILSDPEKRRQYDQFGEEAFSSGGGFQQGGQRFHFSDASRVFSWVFGDGGQFEFDMGGFGGGHHQPQRNQPEEEFYKEDPYVVNLTDQNFEEEGIEWIRIIEFYAPWCGHCRTMSSKWKSLAKALQGVIKVAAVNCDKFQALCQQENIDGYPTIRAYIPGQNRRKDYNGERSLKGLERWAVSLIPNSVVKIKKQRQMEDFLEHCSPGKGRNKASWKLCIVLFTEKQDTSALYKSLSFMYKDKIVFGEVSGKTSAFDAAFNVTSHPSLYAVCNGQVKTRELFQKKMNPDRIRTFLYEFAAGRKCDRTVVIDSAKDVESLTAAQLRELLREKGVACDGCIEKSDYVKRVKEII